MTLPVYSLPSGLCVGHCIPGCIVNEEETKIDCDKDRSQKISISERDNVVA
jgi:hypothetical protein